MHEENFLYRCDPEKNKECRKTDCQRSCFMTTHEEYSVDGKKYVWDRDDFIECKVDNLEASEPFD